MTPSFETSTRSCIWCQTWISGSCSLCMQLEEEGQQSSQPGGPGPGARGSQGAAQKFFEVQCAAYELAASMSSSQSNRQSSLAAV